MGIAAKDQDHLLLKTITDKCELVASQRSCHCLLKQLNVDANKKANKHQQQYRKAHSFVLLSTHAGAFMTLAEGTITAKVITELHSFATGPPLRLHIQERNQWTDRIMSTINWVAHGKAFNGMIARCVHFTKVVHKSYLPTFQRLNKITNQENTQWKCTTCLVAEETREFMLRCPHVEQSRLRTAFMAKMVEFHERKICPR